MESYCCDVFEQKDYNKFNVLKFHNTQVYKMIPSTFFHKKKLFNKIPQATPCGATLVVSVSFTSISAFYIHIFGDKKQSKNRNSNIYQNLVVCSPQPKVFCSFLQKNIDSYKLSKLGNIFAYFFLLSYLSRFKDNSFFSAKMDKGNHKKCTYCKNSNRKEKKIPQNMKLQ